MTAFGLRVTAERNAAGEWHAVVYLGDRELAEAYRYSQAAAIGIALGEAAAILGAAEEARPGNGGPAT